MRRGYLVRTRADLPLETVKAGDLSLLDAALASGAQIISTDFPTTGMSARHDTDYVGELPGGGIARCNPISAGRSCRDDRLEWVR